MNSAARLASKDMHVGLLFITTLKLPWGAGNWHTWEVECQVTRVHEDRLDYVVTRVISESGRPDSGAVRTCPPGTTGGASFGAVDSHFVARPVLQ